MAADEQLRLDKVAAAMGQLSSLVQVPDKVPEFSSIGPHKLRAEVVKRLLGEVVGVYEAVYAGLQ